MKNKTILLVDDEERVLKSLRRMFKGEKVNILMANSGEEAIEMIKYNEIAVIVTDERMGGTDGVEVLRNVTQWSPDTFRVLLTGYADLISVIEAINRGEVNRYVSKPWNNMELIEIVKEGLYRYDIISENRLITLDIIKQRDQLKMLTSSLEEKIKERTGDLEKNQNIIKINYFKALKSLAFAVDERNPCTDSSSKNVSELSLLVANDIRVSDQEKAAIRIASLLHDIGNISIKDEIFLKPEKLTNDEFEEIKKHPLRGAEILEPIEDMKEAVNIIKHHHEHFGGGGYNAGLREQDIPIGSRIIAVCDAYDAMTSDRPYRKSLGHDKAISELKTNYGPQFDPTVVKSFLNIIDNRRKNKYLNL